MPAIWAIMRAIRGSDLPPTDRHILITLASLADGETGIIPERFMPSFSDLAHFTGLGRSTVGRRLPFIEEAGWIKRTAPSLAAAWKDKEKNSYLLLIPPQLAARESEDADGEGEPTSPTAGLVPEGVQSDDQSQSGTSPIPGLELVPERDRTSPTAGLEVPNLRTVRTTTSPSERSTHDTKAAPKPRGQRRERLSRRITKRAEELPDEWEVSEEMVAWAKENTPNVGRFATDKFLDHFAGAGGNRGTKKDWDATWRNWMRREQEDFEERLRRDKVIADRNKQPRSGSRSSEVYRDPQDLSEYDKPFYPTGA